MAFYKENDSKQKLVQWIKRKLGFPSVNLEIEDASIEDNIDDALQYFFKFSGETTYQAAIVMPLSAGVDTYQLSDTILNVVSFDATQSFGNSITTLFTPENVLWNEGFMTSSTNLDMVSWEMAHNYLESVKNRFTVPFFPDFDKYTKVLKLTPPPAVDLTGILFCYVHYSHGTKSTVYNEIWVKQYALALTKITIGHIRSKYSGLPIPGAGTLNGDSLLSEGNAEKTLLEDTLIEKESDILGFYVM